MLASLRAILSRIRGLFAGGRLDSDFEQEMESHVAMLTDENIRAGMAPDEARRAARLKLGSAAQLREAHHEQRTLPWLESLAQDIRFALRMLRKNPGFTAVAVLTLALGIGANTAIFSLVDAALLRPIPVRDPQHLVVFRWSARANPKLEVDNDYDDCAYQTGVGDCSFSIPFFKTVRAQAGVFSGMAGFAGPLDVDLSGNGSASIAHGTYVSDDFFSTLGVNMFLGRQLGPSDDSPSAPPVVVLNYSYWVRAFGSDRSVIGRTVHLDNTTATIVGVSDSHFTSLTPGKTQDFFMPFSLSDGIRGERWANQTRASDSGIWWVIIIGRLEPGISMGQAQAAATIIFRNATIHGSKPLFNEDDAPEIHLASAQAALNGETNDISPLLYTSFTIVGFILLIACANVAGLSLARSAARQKEVAVRLALGAGRARLIRQLLTESLLLSFAGGLLGFVLAFWRIGGIVGIISTNSTQPFPYAVGPDWRVLVFAIGTMFVTGILFGLAPALRGSRLDLTSSLKENASSRAGSASRAGRWLRLGDALVVAQVALSIVVLIGAGLLVRTLRNLRNLNVGFDARNVLLFNIDPTIAGYTDQQTQQLYSNLQERFAALPGVISASYSEDALLDGSWSAGHVHLDGAPPKQNVNPGELTVGLNFFSTMDIPMLTGRTFTPADFGIAIETNVAQKARSAAAKANSESLSTSSSAALSAAQSAYDRSAPVPVIINEAFAQKFLPKQDPVGMHIGGPQTTDAEVQHPGPGYTVIGVVGDTKYAHPRRDIAPIMFIPLVSNEAYFELRTATNPSALVKNVREVVSQTGGNLPLTHVITQTEEIENQLSQERLMSRLSGFYGGVALALACIGLYGLLAYEVARRTRELGIRMALGARRRDLLRLVIGQGLLLALIGSAIGIGAAIGVTRFMSAMLYGIQADDPLTFAGVAILLIFVALFACYVPARRAMRVDPIVALRNE
jgi:predicted permease